MELYLVWFDGKTLLGEFDVKTDELLDYLKDTGGIIEIKNAVEVKTFLIPTPRGMAEVVHTSSIIPFRKELLDLWVKPSFHSLINETEELFKLYMNFRGELTGIIMESDQTKLRVLM